MAQRMWFAAAAGLALAAMVLPAEAQRKGERGYAMVRACSIYGNGCITLPIRPGRFDYEFRMPGGTWVSCRRDCKTAIREEVLDFWETQRERQPSGPFR